MTKQLHFRKFITTFLSIITFTSLVYLRAQSTSESIIFVSTDISEWSVEGRVSYQTVDTTLGFIFNFDEENPPQARPDTVFLDLIPTVDLEYCDSAFVRYYTADNLPNTESWVAGNVQVLVSHEYSPTWVEIYDEDISHLVGWVHQLRLRLKVAVRTDPDVFGEFLLYNIRLVGDCSP